jgi:NAD(P)-dependent dehydrogenase (short-subunit alcohol dehydrogenase family)
MKGICEGRVVVVTGAGRGIGRGHALEFARQGARVVVNDLGVSVDGAAPTEGPAHEVAEEIRRLGGEAVANGDDVSSFAGAERLIRTAIDAFGQLDVLVNNAGILRDRMFANMSEEEWDAVIRVHLKGTFAPTKHAVAYWRGRAKSGATVDARVINTSSTSGIFGNVGQSNYGAAKAGIAAFTIILSQELERFGITVNAIAPGALTRMTENLVLSRPEVAAGQFNPRDAENVAPLVVWLGSSESRAVTGRLFLVSGGRISVGEGWRRGPTAAQDARWDPAKLGDVIPGLVAQAALNSTMRS